MILLTILRLKKKLCANPAPKKGRHAAIKSPSPRRKYTPKSRKQRSSRSTVSSLILRLKTCVSQYSPASRKFTTSKNKQKRSDSSSKTTTKQSDNFQTKLKSKNLNNQTAKTNSKYESKQLSNYIDLGDLDLDFPSIIFFLNERIHKLQVMIQNMFNIIQIILTKQQTISQELCVHIKVG
ncbi:Hypothetical_protein [Hexamita inflata]|uniref:Hypothetical_protein n=1 Tax=Hexamita inflata TaxID=28002 RepID=A0AA86PFI1_9EUKA|nr:Hypothetical protein HINF_LOCUS24053 [Hexamita inflata]